MKTPYNPVDMSIIMPILWHRNWYTGKSVTLKIKDSKPGGDYARVELRTGVKEAISDKDRDEK